MKQTVEIEVPDGKKAVWKDNKVVFEDIKPKLPKTWEKFDPNTLSPFDGVLGRNHSSHKWTCDLFSDIIVGDECMYHCTGSYYRYCIPYNDDTKHLVGTKDEAPDFYKYWED